MKRRLPILLGLVVLQAVVSWTMFSHAPHSGGDNAGYVALGNALATGQGYVESWDPATPAHTKYPPVFPGLIALLILAGVTTWTGFKSIAFVGGLVTVGATFLWASRRTGLAVGAGVALLTGLSWSLLWHSSYILSDVPFLAFTMLALWGIEEAFHRSAGATGEGEETATRPLAGAGAFFVIAGAAAFLAYFTRSAGLPLVVAILGALALRRLHRPAIALGVGLGLPAAIWFVRGLFAGSDEGRYASELLLVNPYDPALGTVGVAGFVARIGENAVGYATEHLPRAFAGSGGGGLALISFALLAVAAIGWGKALRERRGPAELFLPLYLGLILIWPQVWSGDRFALPLLPLLYLYGAEGIRAAQATLREKGVAVAQGVLAALLLVAMYGGWSTESDWVRRCNAAVAETGPWSCAGQGPAAFALVSRWAGDHLPDGTTALTRKPRIFHALSGLTSRTYPFVESADVFFDEAGAAGADHVILDAVGGQGMRFVAPTILGHPGRFCERISIGIGTPGQTILARIRTPGEAAQSPGASGSIARCPVPGAGGLAETAAGMEIPLLRRDR